MKTLTMIAVAALFAAPALAQTVHDPWRRPSQAESRIDRNFEREQEEAARQRAETREEMRWGREERDPGRRDLPKWERERQGHWEWRR